MNSYEQKFVIFKF